MRASLLHRAGAAVDVGAPVPGQKQMATAEHIERQIAVMIVIAVEEAPFLMAVQRNVGGVEIEHDLAGRLFVCFQKHIHQQRIDLAPITVDLVILRAVPLGRVLEPVERALAGHRLAVRAHRLQFARQNCEQRILAQLVVVVQVLVAQRQPEHPLRHQRFDPVLDKQRVAPVCEAARKAAHQSQTPIQLPQEQATRVRGDRTPVKTTTTFRPSQVQTRTVLRYTRRHRGSFPNHSKIAFQKDFRRFRTPMHSLPLRNRG